MTKKNRSAALLFLFLLLALIAPQAGAAFVATPAVEGLSGGTYKPLTMPNLAGSNFAATGKIWVNGRLINIPGYLPPAPAAAQFAKTSLWLNPWLLGASLLAWADDAGLGSDYVNGGGWVKSVPGVGSASCSTGFGLAYGDTYVAACSASIAMAANQCPNYNTSSGGCFLAGATFSDGYVFYNKSQYCTSTCSGGAVAGDYLYDYAQYVPGTIGGTEGAAGGTTTAATADDFNALPAPPVEALAELAPQVGVPVDAPVYAPADLAIGDPYTRPDGSTAQPMAKISPQPEGDVMVDTYDLPLTTPTGDPVTNPTPQDTTEPPPQENQCDKYPNTVGCTDLGTPVDGELLPHVEVPLTFTPVAIAANASCPAPMTVSAFGRSIPVSYDAACTYASGLKPIVIAIAYLSALFIIFGVQRSTNG